MQVRHDGNPLGGRSLSSFMERGGKKKVQRGTRAANHLAPGRLSLNMCERILITSSCISLASRVHKGPLGSDLIQRNSILQTLALGSFSGHLAALARGSWGVLERGSEALQGLGLGEWKDPPRQPSRLPLQGLSRVIFTS